MGAPRTDEPDLPEYMTRDELEQLPEQIAGRIELWNGRVVRVPRGPAEHQTFTYRMTAAFAVKEYNPAHSRPRGNIPGSRREVRAEPVQIRR